MMGSGRTDPSLPRNQAEELRAIATEVKHPVTRDTVKKLALEYDEMAERLERDSPSPEKARAHSEGPVRRDSPSAAA
jgi:hypothetical protein